MTQSLSGKKQTVLEVPIKIDGETTIRDATSDEIESMTYYADKWNKLVDEERRKNDS